MQSDSPDYGGWGNARTFIEWDISSIPANAPISSAQVKLYANKAGCEKGAELNRTYVFDRITGSWTESGVTWNNQPTVTTTHEASTYLPWSGPGWYTFTVTAQVADARAAGTIYGVRIKDSVENSALFFYTDYCSGDCLGQDGYYPELVVTYETPPPPPSLLGEYAPVLYLHRNEGYYNDPINSMLDQSDLMLLRAIGPIEFRDFIRNGPIVESELPDPTTAGVYYLDMWNATSAPFGGSVSAVKPDPVRFMGYPLTVYGRQVDKTYGGHQYIVLQYWFFYPYNDWHNCHEGDMERVQIVLDKTTETPVPINVTFGQHWGGETVPWNGVSLINGTHLKVFIARGSHASYPTDGDHPVGPCTDKTSSIGVASFPTGYINEYDVPSGNKKGYSLVDISSGYSWVEWPGIWGFYVPGFAGGQSGPPSPANVKINGINVWNDPLAWAADPGSPWIIGQATGSVRLHAYDSGGNHTGLNETGWIEAEIPGTYFYIPGNQSEAELMWIYTSENLTFKLEATGSGESNFSFAKCQSDEVTTNYTHIQVTENTTATLSSAQAPFSAMQIDYDGDGFSDESRFPDAMGNSTLIGHVSFPGRGPAPNAKWIETLEVRFFDNATKLEMYWSPVNATTNSSGYFKITHLPASTTI